MWLKTTLFLDVVDVLKLVFLDDETKEAIWVLVTDLLDLVLPVNELRVVHPAEASDVMTVRIMV